MHEPTPRTWIPQHGKEHNLIALDLPQ